MARSTMMSIDHDTPADMAARQGRGGAGGPRPGGPRDGPVPTATRQAIVIVHGQGMQRPMGTMREFVRSLWVTDDRLKPRAAPGVERDIWIVPDGKSGLLDLQRVTTEPFNNRKTDFFELYYADLLDDTPFRKLWGWMQRLLWISPNDVTHAMRWPWSFFWILNVVVATLTVAFVLAFPTLFHADLIAPIYQPAAQAALTTAFVLVVLRLLPKFIPPIGRTEWIISLLERLPNLLVIGAVGIAVIITYLKIPVVPLSAGLLFLYYMGTTTFLPLFGDAASYLSAQSETVAPRQAVRERGLALLTALHDDATYDRIVVVAHSLGTVLAYDLLTFLWHAVGPTKENLADKAAMAAIDAVDKAASLHPTDRPWTRKALQAYRALQWAAFLALRAQTATPGKAGKPARRAGWKVSDFVSLGSPLASAQFLVTEGRAEFAERKTERVMPTSPPVHYDGANKSTYIDPGLNQKVAHHAAVFSVVRWTNIYDMFHPVLIVPGDVISGPVGGADRFGHAIYDRRVRIRFGTFAPRWFTHNHYWIDTLTRPGVPPSGMPPRHVRLLRQAVDIVSGQ